MNPPEPGGMPTPVSPDAGDGAAIAEAVCIPLWSSLPVGRRRQAHGLARVGETLARDSVAIATANEIAAATVGNE